MLNEELEREAFEAWVNESNGNDRAIKRGAGDSYELMQTHLYWLAWKARAELHVHHGEYICGKCGIGNGLALQSIVIFSIHSIKHCIGSV
jgi:hypothetical protein